MKEGQRGYDTLCPVSWVSMIHILDNTSQLGELDRAENLSLLVILVTKVLTSTNANFNLK